MDERQIIVAELRENQRFYRRHFWFDTGMVIAVSLAGVAELWLGNFFVFLIWGASFAIWLDMAQGAFRIWRKCVALLKTASANRD